MIHPAGYRIMAKPDEVNKEHEVSPDIKIILAVDEKLEKGATMRGTVLEVGEIANRAHVIGKYGEQVGRPWVKPGMVIYWAKYSGKFIKFEDQEFLFINDEDVVAYES